MEAWSLLLSLDTIRLLTTGLHPCLDDLCGCLVLHRPHLACFVRLVFFSPSSLSDSALQVLADPSSWLTTALQGFQVAQTETVQHVSIIEPFSLR